MTTALRILIADDHPMFRRGLKTLLSAQEDMDVVTEVGSAAEAISKATKLLPDLILMDLNMPGGGLWATREIHRLHPDIHILVVTMFQDDDSVFTALRAGARGYVLKDADEEEMLRAVRAVGEGEAIFSPEVAWRVLTYFAHPPTLPRKLFPELTAREREVLSLIAQRKGNPAIAKRLGLTLKTVANYVSNVVNKLQVADRAAAAERAREMGLDVEE